MGVRLLATALAAAALATPASFLQSRQASGGGFAEPGGQPTAGLTAWAAIALRASGGDAGEAHTYLVAHESELQNATDVALATIAERVTGGASPQLAQRLRSLVPPTLNAAAWQILALRQLGEPPPPAQVRRLLAHQSRSGGWSWLEGSAPDSNDTAAVIEALGPRPATVRALGYLRRLQNHDGGFELTDGRGSDAQSTAWAIQAFLTLRQRPPRSAYSYLARLRRADGSYRYSTRYTTTPVWVTSQVLAALSGKSLPLS